MKELPLFHPLPIHHSAIAAGLHRGYLKTRKQPMAHDAPQPVASAYDFRTTHWSLVLTAGDETSRNRDDALDRLCRTYWYPLYAYVRRKGRSPQDAEDLTQGFFESFLQRNYLHTLRADKGKFRSFLLASMNHYLANDHDHRSRQKRGGGVFHFSWEELRAEAMYLREPADDATPEKLYEQRWAQVVLEEVLSKLRAEFDDSSRRFEVLKGFLLQPKGDCTYAQAAAQLSLSEPAVKSAIHRMRQRYGELFRAEIAQTVSGPDQIESEIHALFLALR